MSFCLSVVRLARKLQQEQHNSNIRRLQQMSGQPQPRKKPKYVRIDAALRTIVDDYQNRDPVTYLGDFARVLNINVG